MKLVTINGNGGNDHDVSVHAAGCKDVAKSIRGHDYFNDDFPTKRELWLDYNSDFLAEGSGAWPIHFYPCTSDLPDGGTYNTVAEDH